MPEWLDAAYVGEVLGADLVDQLDTVALEEACTGARGFVEDRRRDLFETIGEVASFMPGPSVRYGAALLAHRLYARRTSPLGVLGFTEDGYSGILREDPDIARLLGIGRNRRFWFGAGRPDAPVTVT